MLLFILPFALLAGSSPFAASIPSKIWSTVTTSVVPQHPSPTAVHSASSVASPNDPPPTPPSSWTVEVPTTVETPPLLPPWLPRAPQLSPVPMSGDLVLQYYDKNISTQDLLIKLNMTRGRFDVSNICPSLNFSCESVCSLDGYEAQERKTMKTCYCDKLCLELGDCCYDYFLRCNVSHTPKPQHPKRKCVKTSSKKGDHGYALIGTCPSSNLDKNLESLCTANPSTEDLFKMLPVSTLGDNIVYKNVFCARCNHVSNPVYWKFSTSCYGRYTADDIPKNKSLLMKFILKNCDWSFDEPSYDYSYLKQCLAVKKLCPYSERVEIEPLLPSLCSFYAFPVCENVQANNPHCAICLGDDISASDYCYCANPTSTVPSVGHVPPLVILFDFSSSSSHSVHVEGKKTVYENKVCTDGFLFDPFAEKCIKIHEIEPASMETEAFGSYNCSGSGFVKIDLSSGVTVLSNGSVWIPLHQRTYSNGSYFINGSSVYICMNLTRNYTKTTKRNVLRETITAQHIITYVGCGISMVSLILLLGIYIIVAELRTLPGKNLMSLSCAMLLYHTVYLLQLTGQTDQPSFCTTVSVLLHYFMLSSFCWMSVMAFDVAKTFGKKGQTARSSSPGGSKAALVKYSLFAWASPAVIVITSVTLDKTNTIFIGYGDKICWISNGKALLVVLGVPVALILLFNCVALSLTLVSIWKVQKSTRRVADQSQQTSLPVLCIKLSSALGFTWVLGFIVPFAKLEFLDYLFVILKSLQGFFIFLAFVANKRSLNKVKRLWRSRARSKSAGTHSGNNKTRDTRL